MKPQEVEKYFELEMKDVNQYVDFVMKGYMEQGVRASPQVKESAKITYIIATLNKLKGATDDKKGTTITEPIKLKPTGRKQPSK